MATKAEKPKAKPAKKLTVKEVMPKKTTPPKKVAAKKKPAVKKLSQGRPTDYTPELLAKAKGYVDESGYMALDHAVPSIAGLAMHLGIARATVYAWAKEADKKPFSDILERILSTQEQIALSRGLTGEYNSTIVKLLLGKHGYSDKAETQSTISFENLTDDELNAKIKSLFS